MRPEHPSSCQDDPLSSKILFNDALNQSFRHVSKGSREKRIRHLYLAQLTVALSRRSSPDQSQCQQRSRK